MSTGTYLTSHTTGNDYLYTTLYRNVMGRRKSQRRRGEGRREDKGTDCITDAREGRKDKTMNVTQCGDKYVQKYYVFYVTEGKYGSFHLIFRTREY